MLNIETVGDYAACSACGACKNVCPLQAISFVLNEYGFDYPKVDEQLCVSCGKCVGACASAKNSQLSSPIHAFAAAHTNSEIVMKSSSGGVFTAVAEYVLSCSGAVCGCVYDEQLMPMHICTEKKDDILLMRKSKYAQSKIGSVYQEVLSRLKRGQLVLFTGTPCQVSALYAVVGKGFENLLTMDLVCHGVPSRLMFKGFLEYLESKYHTQIVDFDFRSKKYGWNRFTAEFTDQTGRKRNIGKINEFYMYSFALGNLLRPNCYSCRFACSDRVGDITVGDFWGYEELDFKINKKQGLSLVTANNAKAQSVLQSLSKTLALHEIDYSIAVAGNTCLRHPSAKGKQWEAHMLAVKNHDVTFLARKHRKQNKKRIFIGSVKLLVPMFVVELLKKKSHKKGK